MATQIQIVNRALSRLGIKKQLTALTGTTVEEEQATLFWAPTVENLLESFDHWGFAHRLSELSTFPVTASTVLQTGTGTGTVAVGPSGTTGTMDVVLVIGFNGVAKTVKASINGGLTYGTAGVSPFPTTCDLATLGVTLPTGALVSLVTTGAASTWVAADTYAFTVSDGTRDDWGYQFSMPPDCLKIHGLIDDSRQVAAEDRTAFSHGVVAGSQIIWMDVEKPTIKYTAKLSAATDAPLYPPLFADAVAWTLAAEMALPLKVDARIAAGLAVQAARAVDRAQVACKSSNQEDQIPDGALVSARG